MRLLPSLRRGAQRDAALSVNDWLSFFSYGGVGYPIQLQQTTVSNRETVDPSFQGYVQGFYQANGVVFACMLARLMLFAEARFQFRRIRDGRPGEMFGTAELAPLEEPWPGGTTGDLLARIIQFADLAGNAYVTRHPSGQLEVLRPDWTTIILGSNGTLDQAELVGYSYKPGGPTSRAAEVSLLPEDVAHFAPIPDPSARYRGMSWLTPIVQDVLADRAAMSHRLKFYENGATSNMVVMLDPTVQEQAFDQFIEKFRAGHEGAANAYKTIFLGGGADVKVVGNDFKQMDFKVVQGAGETRVAAAAGVPPVIVGLSEGLAAATYSNYQLAMRRFVDLTMRPLWRNLAGSLAAIIQVPGGAELWYDDRDIPALHESARDEAEIQQIQALTIHSLITAGFTPASAVDAVVSSEMSHLEHTGLLSVQLTPIGAVGEGKGSLVAGTPVPASQNGQPAVEGQNAARAIEPSPNVPEVHVYVPEQPPPVVNVDVEVPTTKRRIDVERDGAGLITAATVEDDG